MDPGRDDPVHAHLPQHRHRLGDLVQLADAVQDAAAGGAAHPRGVGEEQDGVPGGAELDALILAPRA